MSRCVNLRPARVPIKVCDLPLAIASLLDAVSVLERFKRGLVALLDREKELANWFVVEWTATANATEAAFTLKPTKRLRRFLAAGEAVRRDDRGVKRSALAEGKECFKRGRHAGKVSFRHRGGKRGGGR